MVGTTGIGHELLRSEVKVLKMRLDKKTFDKRDVFPSELLSKKNVICWTFLKVMVKLFIDE